jgi:hypothetical protein
VLQIFNDKRGELIRLKRAASISLEGLAGDQGFVKYFTLKLPGLLISSNDYSDKTFSNLHQEPFFF